MRTTLLVIAACLAVTALALAQAPEAPPVTQAPPVSPAPEPMAAPFLYSGNLEAGEKALLAQLKQKPDDDQARFGLGVLRLVATVQRQTQYLYRFGFQPGNGLAQMTPFGRLPVPLNPDAQPVTYEDARTFFKMALDDLQSVESTLAAIKDRQVKLPLRLGMIQVDLDGDGQRTEAERFWRVVNHVLGARAPNPDMETLAQQFTIGFDHADVLWLRGYCNLLSAMLNIALAHDEQLLFEHTAHMFFAKPKSPYPFLTARPDEPRRQLNFVSVVDVVAFVHLLNLPLKEPQRMPAALANLQNVLALSRQSWESILAETDNDAEWIPNPNQQSAMMGMTVTAEMVQGWMLFLTEAEDLLAGRKLLPFWRPAPGQGINLRRVFTEPDGLDVVLWVQGPGAAAYLEQGPITQNTTWQDLMRRFGGRFFGFAVWFN